MPNHFDGFSDEALEFVRDLAANNTREFFTARKDDYQDHGCLRRRVPGLAALAYRERGTR